MNVNKFKILLDKLKGYTKHLYFHVMGEPLVHPMINEFIDMASACYSVNLTSNGYLIERIGNNKNIRQLNLSLHSFNDKNGKSLDEYINDIFDNVDKLVKNKTIVNYRMWINSDNKREIIKYLEGKYKVKIGDSIKVKLDDNVYYEVEKEFIWPSMDNDYYSEEGSCRGTRDHIGILVDGTVVPCCLDSNGLIKLGNIYKDELNDIISIDLFKEIRNGFLCNKKVHELCKKCNFYDLRR